MNASADKFLEYINNKKVRLSDEISDIIFSLNKGYENELKVSDKKLEKMFKKTTREVLFYQLGTKEDFDNEIEALKNGSRHDFKNNIDNLIYLAVLNRTIDFLASINMENDIIDSNLLTRYDELTTKFDRYTDYETSVKSCLVENNFTALLFPFKDFVEEIEKSDINKKHKCEILLIYISKLRYDLLPENCDKIPYRLKENYKDIKVVFDKFNVFENQLKFSGLGIILFLKTLGLSTEFISDIQSYLINYMEQKNISNEYVSNISSGLEKYEEKEEENHKLKTKLEEYFDLKDMHLKRFLNREETNIALSILKELGYSEEIIRKFIWDNDSLFSNEDFLIRCEYILGRAKFYSSTYGFENEYNDFEDYYNGYLEAKSSEDKELYHELLEISYGEIISLLGTVPRTYEYELSMKKVNFKLILSNNNEKVDL